LLGRSLAGPRDPLCRSERWLVKYLGYYIKHRLQWGSQYQPHVAVVRVVHDFISLWMYQEACPCSNCNIAETHAAPQLMKIQPANDRYFPPPGPSHSLTKQKPFPSSPSPSIQQLHSALIRDNSPESGSIPTDCPDSIQRKRHHTNGLDPKGALRSWKKEKKSEQKRMWKHV
jgi:hypothetical protein